MAVYLRSIGFSSLEIEDVLAVRDVVLQKPDRSQTIGMGEDKLFAQYYKNTGQNIGITLTGYLNEKEQLIKPHMMPHVVSDFNLDAYECEVHVIDSDLILTYEDNNSDNEIAFLMQDRITYEKNPKQFAQLMLDKKIKKKINVSGISVFGTIILSVAREEDSLEEDEEEMYYNNLVIRSKSGDEQARELLTVYEAKSMQIIRERLKEEDLFSVVDSYFLPVTHSDDVSMYDILGTIEDVEEIINTDTQELVYKIAVNATGVVMQIFINKDDLLGVPILGMRFMGNCRLQGDVIEIDA